MGSETNSLQVLVDERDIREIVNRYARATDRLDPEMLRGCFHPGATIDLGGGPQSVEQLVEAGFATLLAKGKDKFEFETCQHPMFNSLIDFAGPDLARCETYMMSISRRWSKGKLLNAIGAGRLVDRFERRGGQWKIVLRKLIADQYFEIAPDTFDAGWQNDANRGKFGRDDLLYSVVPELK